jgi:hypothetical protein
VLARLLLHTPKKLYYKYKKTQPNWLGNSIFNNYFATEIATEIVAK